MLRTLLAVILTLTVSMAGAQIVNRPVAAGAISNPATTAPTTCAIGNVFFKTNATAGQNLQLCTSANTWTGIADGTGAGSFTTITTGNGENIFGSGGTGATTAKITLNAGSTSGWGPFITFQRNSVSKAYVGLESQLIGNNSDDIIIYAGSGQNVKQVVNASTVTTVSATGMAITGNVTTTTSGSLQGTATNDSAAAGKVGEYQEVNCGIPAASGASVAFTSASPTVGTWTAHPFQKTGVAFGSYACPFTITATAPTGLSTATNYWATPIDANTFHVSTSAANAAAGTWANTSGSSSTSNLTNSIALTTTAGLSPAVLLLTAGDWDCSGQAIRVLGATTSVTNMQTGINSASTTIGSFGTYFDFETAANIMTATSNPIHSTPTVRLSLSATTAEYLVALDTFTASTNTVSGFLRCRRMR